ncbi:sulfotransferase family protein [Kordiimonas lipolytica]|uniref:Sulfotransferase family protein n=1 Tax=Kordiimonas lipolytica TaxID=1662421 RepID=A0ABV8U9C9_9PROT|nr:sulfotransferase [Kordiimonas lipolytica]
MAYIFVGGSQRSGTSLLATSLCSGEETNMYIGECRSLRQLLLAVQFMEQNFDGENELSFGSKAAMKEYHSTIIRSYLSHTLATNAPATSLVLKQPHLTLLFPTLWNLVPESKFVIAIRDPRDTIASMLEVGKKMAAQGQNHPFNTHSVPEIAKHMRGFYSQVLLASDLSEEFKAATKWVRYEELVSQPAVVMEELRAFTGLNLVDFDPESPTKRIHPTLMAARTKDEAPVQPWVSDLMRGAPITTKRTGSYKDLLTNEQISQIDECLAEFMERIGYEPAN